MKKWLKNDKKMKNSSSFWRFPGSEWESTTLSPNFHFFSFATSFFFIFLCFWLFSIVFHCFSWLSWISGATGRENEKKWLKHDKKMKISSSFWRFPGSEWESATLSPNFHFFFICNFIFFHFPLFLDGFPLFFIVFHGFPGFQVPRARKMKKNDKTMIKNDKKMIKKWKFPRIFEDFLVRSENLQLWVQIFIFFSFATSFFFHFPLFLIVFHCFPGFQVPRARKMKKMKFKMKKNEVWNEKNDVWNEKKWSLEKEKTKKRTNKWKINENKKMIEKQTEKNEVTNENPNEK